MEVKLSGTEFSGMLATNDGLRSTVLSLYNGCVSYISSGSMRSGYSAGRSTANEAGAVPDLDGLETEIEAECAQIVAPLAPCRGALPQVTFEVSIRQVVSHYMGFARNGEGMEVALRRLAFIASQADELSASNMHESMLAHESLHLLQSSTLSTLRSPEYREDGCSIYRRSDYPGKDPALDRVLAVCRGADGPEVLWSQTSRGKGNSSEEGLSLPPDPPSFLRLSTGGEVTRREFVPARGKPTSILLCQRLSLNAENETIAPDQTQRRSIRSIRRNTPCLRFTARNGTGSPYRYAGITTRATRHPMNMPVPSVTASSRCTH